MSTILYSVAGLANIARMLAVDPADVAVVGRANVREFRREYRHRPDAQKARAPSEAAIATEVYGPASAAAYSLDNLKAAANDALMLEYNSDVGRDGRAALVRILVAALHAALSPDDALNHAREMARQRRRA